MSRTFAAGVVLYKDDSVLLVKHTKHAKLPTGSYGFPAGRKNKDETLEETAVRELFEETGLETSVAYLQELPARRSSLKMKTGFEDFTFQPYLCTQYNGEIRSTHKTIPEFVQLNRLDDLSLVTEDVATIAKKYQPKA